MNADNKAELIILDESPGLVERVTMDLWKTPDGALFQKESPARYHASTHRKCGNCGDAIPKHSFCRPCHDAKQEAKFLALPLEPWDGSGLLYSRHFDDYTADPEDFLAEKNDDRDDDLPPLTIEECQFQLCVADRCHELDPNEIYEGILPEDQEVDTAVQEAFDVLNARLRELRAVCSWRPVNKRWNGEITAPAP